MGMLFHLQGRLFARQALFKSLVDSSLLQLMVLEIFYRNFQLFGENKDASGTGLLFRMIIALLSCDICILFLAFLAL